MAGILDDATSREMDDVLFGNPNKNPSEASLDPKISEAMDKDLGIERPSIFPKTAVPEPEEPGYVGSLGKGLVSGVNTVCLNSSARPRKRRQSHFSPREP